jgi:hypothetical protein
MRFVARLKTWRPTVRPILPSSPAACTAVVTTSVVLGRPSRRGSETGGGGGAVGFDAGARFFVALAFLVFVTGGFVAVALVVVAGARRSPPIRVGRLDGRLPRTLGLEPAFAVFFVFFFADFSAMRKKVARALVFTGYSHAATRSVTRVGFGKNSA